MDKSNILLLCLFMFVLCSGQSNAEEPGTIVGRVCWAACDIPLSGAHLVILETRFGSMTLTDGTFAIYGVPAGTYSLKAVMPGFQPQTIDSVGVIGGHAVQLQFKLAYNDSLPILECTQGISPYCGKHSAYMSPTIMCVECPLESVSKYLNHSDAKIYNHAREEYFPHCDISCTPEQKDGRRAIKVLFCPECCAARAKWLDEHERIRDTIERNTEYR